MTFALKVLLRITIQMENLEMSAKVETQKTFCQSSENQRDFDAAHYDGEGKSFRLLFAPGGATVDVQSTKHVIRRMKMLEAFDGIQRPD